MPGLQRVHDSGCTSLTKYQGSTKISLSQYFQYVDLYIQHPVSIGVVSATALRLDSGAHVCQGNAPTYLLVLTRYEWKWDKLVLRTATLSTHRIASAQPHVGKAESIALVYKNI